MKIDTWVIVCSVALFFWIVGKLSSRIDYLNAKLSEKESLNKTIVSDLNKKLSEKELLNNAITYKLNISIKDVDGLRDRERKLIQANMGLMYENEKIYKSFSSCDRLLNNYFINIKNESALLPSIVQMMEDAEKIIDFDEESCLRNKKRPAIIKAEIVKEARAAARQAKAKVRLLENQICLYEANAPWLKELLDYSLREVNDALAFVASEKNAGDEDDPVSRYISSAEWNNLGQTERSQVALDRYFEFRQRNAWLAGIAYERYVGYIYEKDGFSVIYNGAVNGKSDLGIDLICKSNSALILIQCKRLSPAKQMPVRENVVSQLIGASMFFCYKNDIDFSNVKMVIATTYILSDEAKEFAKSLGVDFMENLSFDKYSAIKCHVGKSNTKIYHLPFDQQYDKIHMKISAGDKFVSTVAEAERLGFRRAFKWSGEH